MADSGILTASAKPRLITVFTWSAIAAWTAVLGGSLVWNLRNEERQTMDMAYAEAKANLNKDITLRRWVTDHGGVYVPITEKQHSVPWLSHVPGRDVTTTDGRQLTLLNPASVVRQMMDRYAQDYGIRGRITGLKYLNPGNAPDVWEKEQLEAFTHGERKEVWAVADMDGQPHLRYLRAMFMEPGCEKCHAILGYKLGDMRGATGVNLPLAPFYQQISDTRRNLGTTHGAIWLLGLVGIGLSSRTARQRHQQREFEQAERTRAEKRYRTLFEQSRDGILTLDPETARFVAFNTVAHEQLGYGREEFAGLRLHDVEMTDSSEGICRRIDFVQAPGWSNFETRHRHKDGSIRDVQVVAQWLVLDDRPMLHCTFRDITDRKAAERELHIYASIFNHSGEGILVTDRDNRIVAVNPAFTQLTGYAAEEVLGRNPRVLASGKTPPQTYQTMWASLRASDFWQGELWDRRKDGTIYPKWTVISVIRDSHNEIAHYVGSFTDISERKAAEDRIDYLAHYDPLTGLLNRFNLEMRLEQALLSAHRSGEQVAVMFIDMDRFKTINDTLGHHVGDLLLAEVGRRLRTIVRESDIIARFGGDEFVVVLAGMSGAVGAAPVASKILQNLGMHYTIDDNLLHSTPSIGISVFPEDGIDTATLMKNADTAMYHAKDQGRNNVQFFTAAMNVAASERMTIERELRVALAEGQLELHYQPQIRTDDGRTCGVEALVRWRHPQRGLVPPLAFIPIAEDAGLIEDLGAWVLNEACRQTAAWRAEGIADIKMAVNVSAHQLRSSTFVATVHAALTRHGLRGSDLELEITESVAMADPERAIERLQSLRQLGIDLSIDDFGTGYSSLAYLKLLPIQRLKLDRAFVRDIETDENDAAISAATVALAHSLGLKVVAEGVETEGQRHFLERHRCDFLQGYLLGRPAPATVWSDQWKAPNSTS
ncbi:MAG: EAL domain-containing protein [Rhodocyclaceae bacterium]|nr:EAL domain-containing protein [Rhodocyclaceae bacterium]